MKRFIIVLAVLLCHNSVLRAKEKYDLKSFPVFTNEKQKKVSLARGVPIVKNTGIFFGTKGLQVFPNGKLKFIAQNKILANIFLISILQQKNG